jgi:hypothetical protein
MSTESTPLPRTLLIVDDEKDIREILLESLAPICDHVLTACDGVEALSIIEKNPNLCAVLSDIRMPHMDGLALLSHLRTQFNPIPFVVLTAFGDTQSYQEAIRLNATDFLEKPIVHEELKRVMNKAIQYGCEVIKLDQLLNNMISELRSSFHNTEEILRAKRTVMLMRIENSIYLKNETQKRRSS